MIIMELLTTALVALGGTALFLQAKALPSEQDAQKAKDILDRSPLDPAANTTYGKYLAFVQGDYNAAMPYLVNSDNQTLKGLATHELDATYTATAPQKIGMGDDWVKAAKNFQPLNKIFYERATQWYGLAWPDLEGPWKDRSREQMRKILGNPGVPDPKGVSAPSGWKINDNTQRGSATQKASRGGKVSYQMLGGPKMAGMSIPIEQSVPAVPGKTYEFSAWVLSDGTDGAEDQVAATIYAQGGRPVDVKRMYAPADQPWWHKISTSFVAPANASLILVQLALTSKVGSVFVDDVSLKVDGRELLKNGSFEDK